VIVVSPRRQPVIWSFCVGNLIAKNPEIGAGLDRVFGPCPAAKGSALNPWRAAYCLKNEVARGW